jgi:hypothetical protein
VPSLHFYFGQTERVKLCRSSKACVPIFHVLLKSTLNRIQRSDILPFGCTFAESVTIYSQAKAAEPPFFNTRHRLNVELTRHLLDMFHYTILETVRKIKRNEPVFRRISMPPRPMLQASRQDPCRPARCFGWNKSTRRVSHPYCNS